ncbi:nuclear pore complex protein Nup160-like [Tropilaelaps mercedesae]|uniref:Nuclear pore complex protein Nup160-like n=1 Tax=Tropilaelaps mercedesae TaxID=418985 RepID=A0A1V9Y0P1_9ACAR|nr:nuclear pore complex protein Nup160-like [Tropilaelaps mercedesae]
MGTEGTRYFRVCARVFLFSACALPPWFVLEYQRRNAAELLAVYVAYERLVEATELAIAMINASLGSNPDELSVRETVASGQTVWLPLNVMDLLQYKLSKIEGNTTKALRERLMKSLTEFFAKVKQVAQIR